MPVDARNKSYRFVQNINGIAAGSRVRITHRGGRSTYYTPAFSLRELEIELHSNSLLRSTHEQPLTGIARPWNVYATASTLCLLPRNGTRRAKLVPFKRSYCRGRITISSARRRTPRIPACTRTREKKKKTTSSNAYMELHDAKTKSSPIDSSRSTRLVSIDLQLLINESEGRSERNRVSEVVKETDETDRIIRSRNPSRAFVLTHRGDKLLFEGERERHKFFSRKENKRDYYFSKFSTMNRRTD